MNSLKSEADPVLSSPEHSREIITSSTAFFYKEVRALLSQTEGKFKRLNPLDLLATRESNDLTCWLPS